MTTATGLPEGASPALHGAARLLGRYMYRPFFRIRVHGMDCFPRTGPVVLIANHSSFIEPQLLLGLVPRRCVFLVKRELFVGPAGTFFRKIGQLAIDRSSPDRAPLLAAVRVLREGGMIGVFPEGTRGDGDVEAAERGAAWLVRASGATVVPVATRGTSKRARTGFRPRVDLLVGEPFTPEIGKGSAGLAEGTEHVRGELAELVRRLDRIRTDGEQA
ncbi:lysophospholipid acyltransferase family protein [Sciscionella marina]|uniref:lysophospholipid acyltransferase family protein n=1 Tax=Sciscionella marina TaxID=508770 RepID=UPI00037819EF|nr:lysophospholipid acyltransferase family protein [Sciscionella marina]